MELKLTCDDCGRPLGTYLFGPGGVGEVAQIGELRQVGLPDIVCFNCIKSKPRMAVMSAEEI